MDECLGRHAVAEALAAAGATVELFADHFELGTDDLLWAPIVGERGWAVLSMDTFSKRRGVERGAFRAAKIAAFVLRATTLSGDGWARAFVVALPRMCHLLDKYRRPLFATVTASGKITIIDGERRGAARKR